MLDARGNEVESNIDVIPRDQILNTRIEDLVEHIMSEICVEPLIIYEEQMVQDNGKIKTEVRDRRGNVIIREGQSQIFPGIKLTVSLPFSGDPKLWGLKTNMATSPIPHGFIRTGNDGLGYSYMVFEHPMNQPISQLKDDVDRNVKLIRSYLAS